MEEDFRSSPYAKLFYRPIEVAVRWCGLVHIEAQILSETDHTLPLGDQCRIFPCIQQKLEILQDAIRHQDLTYGCLGIAVTEGELIEPSFLTIRHADLKSWFSQFHPTEKPDFLFDELERQAISPYTVDMYRSLLVEIEICKTQHERSQTTLLKVQTEKDALLRENIALTSKLRQAREPSERSERTYLRLVGALINLLLGKSPSRKPYSAFTSQASIISALMAHNRNKPGFTQRTLENKFSAAKRSIDDFE